jgi:uncharacterized protein with von Willebrand factor type A (vWA) domain
MHKPLWLFFNVLREKSSQAISVDQYFDFFTAFNELDLRHIDNLESLRDFCKIFWLNNDSFEAEFNDLFKQYTSNLDLEKLIIKQKESISSNDIIDTPNKEEIITPPSTEKPSNPEIITPKEQQQEALSDFELLVGDGKSKIKGNKKNYLSHQFMLDDLSIIPFKPRFLTQRMRRLVESPKIEWTDELDFERIIEDFSKDGFIEDVKYQKKETSYSHVVLLADHWGSMLAYEYMEQQIARSIRSIPGCRFEHYTFKNLPEYDPKTKGYKMIKMGGREVKTETLNTSWDKNTWIFLLSDGGGLSGMVNKGRMRASFQLWYYLKSKTNHVFWLNPVSINHRAETTAARLNLSIPMLFPIQSELNMFFNKA